MFIDICLGIYYGVLHIFRMRLGNRFPELCLPGRFLSPIRQSDPSTAVPIGMLFTSKFLCPKCFTRKSVKKPRGQSFFIIYKKDCKIELAPAVRIPNYIFTYQVICGCGNLIKIEFSSHLTYYTWNLTELEFLDERLEWTVL